MLLTEEQIKNEIEIGKRLNRISELKAHLAKYDYIGTKIATGRGTREEYATQITQMIVWANEINQLKKELLDEYGYKTD